MQQAPLPNFSKSGKEKEGGKREREREICRAQKRYFFLMREREQLDGHGQHLSQHGRLPCPAAATASSELVNPSDSTGVARQKSHILRNFSQILPERPLRTSRAKSGREDFFCPDSEEAVVASNRAAAAHARPLDKELGPLIQ